MLKLKSSPIVEAPLVGLTEGPASVIGIDIDGTITLDPDFYSAFTRDCKRSGVIIHIVSARPPESRADTEAELCELEIVYDELHLLRNGPGNAVLLALQ